MGVSNFTKTFSFEISRRGTGTGAGHQDGADEGLGLRVGSAVVRRAAVRARAPVLRLIISADYVLTMSLDNL